MKNDYVKHVAKPIMMKHLELTCWYVRDLKKIWAGPDNIWFKKAPTLIIYIHSQDLSFITLGV